MADPAISLFDQGREAFKTGNYTSALSFTDQALRSLPNDPALHEFRSLVLFALAASTTPRRPSTRCCRSGRAGTGRP